MRRKRKSLLFTVFYGKADDSTWSIKSSSVSQSKACLAQISDRDKHAHCITINFKIINCLFSCGDQQRVFYLFHLSISLHPKSVWKKLLLTDKTALTFNYHVVFCLLFIILRCSIFIQYFLFYSILCKCFP